jgi:hypothetical protein
MHGYAPSTSLKDIELEKKKDPKHAHLRVFSD